MARGGEVCVADMDVQFNISEVCDMQQNRCRNAWARDGVPLFLVHTGASDSPTIA